MGGCTGLRVNGLGLVVWGLGFRECKVKDCGFIGQVS